MPKSKIYEDINTVIESSKSNPIRLCTAVLDLMKEQPAADQEIYFESFLKGFSVFQIKIENPSLFFSYIDTDNAFQKKDEIAALADRLVSNLIKKNVTESEFYTTLWSRLFDDTLIVDGEDRICLLMLLWCDPRIPYYQLPSSCSMEDEEYRLILQAIQPQLKKARFIVFVGFPQKTETMSQLMRLADELKDYKQRAVFWAKATDLLTIQKRK